MLAEIEGHIVRKIPGLIWLRTGALTWEINIPFTLSENLPPPGETIRLAVCLLVRGEALELYGFPDERYRETFRLLAALPRIGPRLALNVLALFPPHKLEEIVASEDTKALATVPGIGPRRAERLCLELRARLGLKRRPREGPSILEEALLALENLGFSSREAREALEKVYTGEENLDELLRKALKIFSPS